MRATRDSPIGSDDLERLLGAPVVALERRPHAYRTSHLLEELDLELADGSLYELVAKDCRPEALSETARAAKPAFLDDPEREAAAYRDLLDADLGTPRFYGAAAGVVLLERVRGAPLTEIGDFTVWAAAARWLAGLHARFQGLEHPNLVRRGAVLSRCFLDRACAFRPGALDGLVPAIEDAAAVLDERPGTLLHGEFYASNVLVAGHRICPIDWELAAMGPGALDLAALTAGSWTDEERRELALAYHDALGERQPVGELLADLERARLLVAVQWLGWAEGWIPPAEMRRDWLADACAAAARLVPR